MDAFGSVARHSTLTRCACGVVTSDQLIEGRALLSGPHAAQATNASLIRRCSVLQILLQSALDVTFSPLWRYKSRGLATQTQCLSGASL